MKRLSLGMLLLIAAFAARADAILVVAEDQMIRIAPLAGNLSSTGSDTLANLMTLWADAYRQRYPQVNLQVQAPGSSTAGPALTQGTANFGPMSRRMKRLEMSAFENRHGYRPTGIRVAMDALAIYVHKDNPLPALTLSQIDAMFSATRRCGAPRKLRRWGDLGLAGSWRNRVIQLYGRNAVSGTYGYFKQVALCSGDFLTTVSEQPGSASVVQSVAANLAAIGYSGIGYRTSGVRSVPIAYEPGEPARAPTEANALSGAYPLTRYLYIYVNRHPDEGLSALEHSFLSLVLSDQGQAIVRKDGYIPLTSAVRERERSRLEGRQRG